MHSYYVNQEIARFQREDRLREGAVERLARDEQVDEAPPARRQLTWARRKRFALRPAFRLH